MDKYATGIYPTERRLRPLLSRSIAILSVGVSEKLAIATESALEEEERHDSNYTLESIMKNTVKLRVAKKASIKLNNM